MNDTYNYVRNLVLSNLQDNRGYVCYTYTNSDYNQNVYDIYCFFGNDIKLNNYRITGALKRCMLDTNTYYNNNNLEKLVCDTTSSSTINNYETIYTNLDNKFASIVSDYEYEKNNNISYNLDLNYMYLLVLLLVLIFLCPFIKTFFKGVL